MADENNNNESDSIENNPVVAAKEETSLFDDAKEEQKEEEQEQEDNPEEKDELQQEHDELTITSSSSSRRHRMEILKSCIAKEEEKQHELSGLLSDFFTSTPTLSSAEGGGGEEEESIQFIKSLEEAYGTSLQDASNLWRVEIRLKDFNYMVPTQKKEKGGGSRIQTVYNSTFIYHAVKLLKKWKSKKEKKEEEEEEKMQMILNNVNLVLQPGKTYLVLGPPGSGKTSLLRAIAGLLPKPSPSSSSSSPSPPKSNNTCTTGSVSYNGITHTENSEQLILSNAISFIDQIDRHAPRLTVYDTFQFAFQCKSAGTHSSFSLLSSPPTSSQIEDLDTKEFRLNLISKMLGLSHVLQTFVGNEDIRGVSGGQRRRVTTGEMLMYDAPILCADEISTGLDAASTYSIIQNLALTTKVMGYTRIISLLQPSPETFSLFDSVVLLSEGYVIYAGSVKSVLQYFTELGYEKPQQMDVADYLQIIGTVDGRVLCQHPKTPKELAEAFKQSLYFRRMKNVLEKDYYEYDWRKKEPLQEEIVEEKEDEENVQSRSPTVQQYISNSKKQLLKRYKNTFFKSTYLNLQRFLTIWKRDKRFLLANIIRNVAMGISVGVVFYQTDSIDSIYGVLFQGMQFVMLGTMTSAPDQLTDRQIFYKHSDANFYPTFSYVIGRALSMLPQALMDTFLFGTIIYWMVGLYAGAAQFFIYVAIILVFTIVMNQKFAIFAAFASTKNEVQALGAVLLLVNLLFCGFIVAPNVIPDYYIWIYWWAPMAWAYRALLVNEYYSPDYDNVVEGTDPPVTEGEQSLISKGFTMSSGEVFGEEWIKWAFVYLLSYQGFLLVVNGIVLHYVRVKKKVVSTRVPQTSTSAATVVEVKRRLSNTTRRLSALVSKHDHGDANVGAVPANNNENELEQRLLDEEHRREHENGDEMVEDHNNDTNNNNSENFDLPFTEVDLSFHNICYEVTASTNNEKLKLLNNVNGVFKSGRMCALMGSSGAGKTTLMDVIALRKNTGTVEGEVCLNGHLQEPRTFRRCSGYVEQFDVQSPQLTVRETILFSARLRLDLNSDALKDKPNIVERYVDKIINMLELTSESGLLVGSDEEGGLTFEQTKRLSIAVELAASPSIIFLDEPTSGLDSRAALLVMKSLRKIAETGRTVCATIHQPSSAVFEMFDDLLLLIKGGNSVYFGELGFQSEYLIDYFETLGATQIMQGENPATWMLTIQDGTDVPDYAQCYVESDNYKQLLSHLEEIKANPDEAKKITFETEYAASGRVRTNLMSTRLRTIYWRSPSYNRNRLLLSVLISLLLGSIFLFDYRPDVMDEVYISGIFSTMFLSFIVIGILAITSVLPVMLKIRDVFYRHRAAGMLNHTSVAWALGTAEKYFLMLASALFTVCFYFTIGLEPDAKKFFAFWGFFTFNWAIYSYFGQLFMCSVRGMATAQILASIFIGINNFFSGLIVRPQFMTGFWQVTYWMTPGHYVYEGLIVTQFNDDNRTVVAYVGSDFYNDLGCQPEDVDCSGTVTQYMDTFFGGRFKHSHRWYDIGVLGGILTIVRILTFMALKKLNYTST